jgi:hypothetical protein
MRMCQSGSPLFEWPTIQKTCQNEASFPPYRIGPPLFGTVVHILNLPVTGSGDIESTNNVAIG